MFSTSPPDLLDALSQEPLLVTFAMGVASLAESALGLGTVVPGETMVTVGAHALDGGPIVWLAWVVVATAAFVGDHVGYLLGRRTGPALAGSALVSRVGAQHWQRATRVLERHGVATLVVGRLVPGVRTLLAPAAGALGMTYCRYALAAALAALLWSALWVGGGSTVVGLVLQLPVPVVLAAGAAVVLVAAAAVLARRAPVLAARRAGARR